ncbi:MAG: AcrR family transcriptional regulator [Lentimonas sp.]|jgi:AcrR family transcriptional regulator
MPSKRSRANTEEKFLNAVLELVAKDGCCALGINAVAHQAGADKVLIYRYFGNLNGLLQRVADSRQWLPSVNELCSELTLTENSPATGTVHQLSNSLKHHVRANKATHQILRWRKAQSNPLTQHFSNEWTALWHKLADQLATDLDYESREAWKRIAALTALTIEAELCDEPVSSSCIDHITQDITIGRVPQAELASEAVAEDQLPTNLL